MLFYYNVMKFEVEKNRLLIHIYFENKYHNMCLYYFK